MKPLDMGDFEITVNKTAATVARLKEGKKRLEEQLKAEASSRAKSQLLANVSHELRTPLNAIILYSQLLKAEAGDAGAQDLVPDLQRIEEAANHLLELINQVLDLSRIEAGKMELQASEIGLRALLDEVEGIVLPMMRDAGNSLTTRYESLPESIVGDPMKLRQCLLNLLSNACKFTHRGEVRLCGSVQGETLVLAVEDSGIGIAPEALERLFQPFFQADPASNRKYGGTGLGLSITKELCELSGGTLICRSAPGQGSTFEMRLPLRISARA
jgi:signal transduction histidine kinase